MACEAAPLAECAFGSCKCSSGLHRRSPKALAIYRAVLSDAAPCTDWPPALPREDQRLRLSDPIRITKAAETGIVRLTPGLGLALQEGIYTPARNE